MGARYDIAITVVGGGKMGEAIVSGWIAAGAVDASRLTVVEPSEERRSQLRTLGVDTLASAADSPPADVMLLAVKPQVIAAVVGELKDRIGSALVVSIAAGISCAKLESLMPAGTAVVRVMPNTPVTVAEGMAVVSGGSDASEEQVDLVVGLFGAVGQAIAIEERYQNAATAISGSGPAYFALVIDALARAGVASGLSRELAQTLAVQTMFGTALMLKEGSLHPEALIDGVASPGGTTIAAVGQLESSGVRAAFGDAVSAAVKRARELGA